MPRSTRPSDTMAAAATDVLEPHDLSVDELRLMHDGPAAQAQAGTTGPAPTLTPPGTTTSAPAVGAWVTGQKVTALWAEQTARNAWLYLETAGWKKLSGLGDTGSTAMTLLGAHARATGTPPVLNEDPAGTASVLYVW